MLKKIFKYDFNSIARIWWILAVSSLGLSLLSGFALRVSINVMINNYDSTFLVFLSVFGMLFAMISFLVLVASYLGTFILVFIRFYKHFFTDEGYLTFTLPVSRKTLLWSKTLNACLWSFLHLLLMIICIVLIIIINFVGVDLPPSDPVVSTPSMMFEGTSPALWITLYIVEFVILAVVSLFTSVALAHFCITIGAIVAKKLKLLAAIGIYYGANSVFSFVVSLITQFILPIVMEGFLEASGTHSNIADLSVIAIFFFVNITVYAVIGIIIYRLTLRFLERKLNLP